MQKYPWLKSDNEDILIVTSIKTKQNEDKFEFEDEKFIIKISAPPVRGKANKMLLKMLRKKFQTGVFLEAGQKSPKKVFRLKNISSEQVLELLNER
ncbi:MAG: DUF167 domain-containing protein [Candidatus Hodarchaeales archaeon]|jgi:uncharacterized protein (TIGR00251 family)